MKTPRASRFSAFVHLVYVGDGRTNAHARWIVATTNGSAGFRAPMSKAARDLTGCTDVFAPSIPSLARAPNVVKYFTREGALRAARRIFGGSQS